MKVLPLRLCSLNGKTQAEAEKELEKILSNRFPKAKQIKVEDVSGGCGAMYQIFVESEDFKGLPIVKQHQSVCEALKIQIESFHGVRIHTKTPK